ncbi:putative pectinesterase 29 [Carex littledalei]|uniref:Pectinesterase n=1 Tax=Carex littledalei TaxID=544730 RepID=A0A833VSN6_9POAL|nr:putative pectinesterase 29 [Carex littledalei]
MLEGEGSDQTRIEWGDHAHDGQHTTASSTTFSCYASNFMARDISFKNTFNGILSSMSQAVAVLVAGDKSAFYRCSFVGIQDTLCDLTGRHYYQDCYIEGALDFIFGQGQSIFERCTISTVSGVEGIGYITAQGRDSKDDWSGFVFKSCNITGSSQTYLGRAWRPYARVILYDTYMTDIITPLGWDAWQFNGWDTSFVEAKCRGAGAKRRGRVQWMKTLSGKALRHYTSLRYINRDRWIQAQPA